MDSKVALSGTPPHNTRSAKQNAIDKLRRDASESTEILEQILSYLSPHQIFSVQRVSRTWKNVIAGSPTIHDRLFLRLQNKPKEAWMIFTFGKRYYDIRLEKVAPDTKSRQDYVAGVSRLDAKFTPVAISPFLQVNRAQPIVPLWLRASRGVSECIAIDHNMSKHSSLLDTLVSDPPCTHALITAKYRILPPHPTVTYVECYYRTESAGALTIRQAVEGPANNTEVRVLIYEIDSGRHFRHGLYGDIFAQMEVDYQCQFVLKPGKSMIELQDVDGDPYHLIPTEAEWEAVRPRVKT